MKNRRKFIMIKLILAIFTFAYILIGCTNSSDLDKIKENLLPEITDFVFQGDSIDIPTTYEKHKITWKANKDGYIDVDGVVTNAEFYDVVIEVSIFADDIYVGKKEITISRRINDYLAEIESFVLKFFKERFSGNLSLQTSYYESDKVEISYQSSRPDIFTNDGKRIDHEYDEDITMFVEIKYLGFIHSFEVDFVHVGISDLSKVEIIKDWLEDELKTMTFTDEMELPITHPLYGGRIRWICEEPDVVLNNKDLFLPLVAGRYMMRVEIAYPSVAEYINYFVDLDATTVTDPLIRAKRFLTYATPTEIDEFVAYYDGTVSVIERNIIGSDAKNQIHYGVKPVVAQSVLNQRLYEGYQMPNDDNVLWIVVHETGTTRKGANAEFFSKMQYDRAYISTNPDRTSWNYTIDETRIIQNYEDNISAWHAGDGSSAGGGNKNGIGIEMCINPDARYEATFRSYARLVAGLLIKHNLNMANVKRHRDFMLKDCPETMIREKRWFEFLDLVTKEYVSQTLLAQFEISYEIKETANIEAWPVHGIYRNTGLITGEVLNVTVTIEGEQINFVTKAK